MQTIPLQQVPNQSFTAVLGGQQCRITLTTLSTGLFLSLWVNGAPIKVFQQCVDRCLLIRLSYLGFVGDLAFMDTQGTEDPEYSGLGERWVLFYVSPGDL